MDNSNINTLKALAVLGACVKNFTDVENSLKFIGQDLDNLVVCEDDNIHIISQIYLHLTELINNAIDWRDDINDFIKSKSSTSKEQDIK